MTQPRCVNAGQIRCQHRCPISQTGSHDFGVNAGRVGGGASSDHSGVTTSAIGKIRCHNVCVPVGHIRCPNIGVPILRKRSFGGPARRQSSFQRICTCGARSRWGRRPLGPTSAPTLRVVQEAYMRPFSRYRMFPVALGLVSHTCRATVGAIQIRHAS